jgi:HTH-type transcriptional regulator, transcriptional repressor of NAD biosynthesis genes
MEAAILRIAVFGPESTGKTTLARRLADRFGEPWSPEFVRGFWDARGGKIAAEDLETIARGQIAAEDSAAAHSRRILFCDTELLTCVLWDDLLFPGKCPDWVRAEADRRARTYALYLFCDTDLPFSPDPQRCFPDPVGRAMGRRLWRDALVSRRLPLVEVRGEGSGREAVAIAAVERLLKTFEEQTRQ